MSEKKYIVRADDTLGELIKKAQIKTKSGTAKKVSVNDMFIDAMESYCKGILGLEIE